MKVVAGTTLIHGGEEQVYQVEYLVAHKDFSEKKLTNDVGLIRVSKDIEFNDKVQPIALPPKGEEFYKAGDSAKLTGWGLSGCEFFLLFCFHFFFSSKIMYNF